MNEVGDPLLWNITGIIILGFVFLTGYLLRTMVNGVFRTSVLAPTSFWTYLSRKQEVHIYHPHSREVIKNMTSLTLANHFMNTHRTISQTPETFRDNDRFWEKLSKA